MHSGKPDTARSSQEPQEEQLDLIIRMMCQCYFADAKSTRGAREELMAQRASRHLDRKLLRLGERLHVRTRRLESYAKFFRCARDEALIRNCCATANEMIEVRRRERPSMLWRQSVHDVEQHHGIQST